MFCSCVQFIRQLAVYMDRFRYVHISLVDCLHARQAKATYANKMGFKFIKIPKLDRSGNMYFHVTLLTPGSEARVLAEATNF